jgi:hypothetical protein
MYLKTMRPWMQVRRYYLKMWLLDDSMLHHLHGTWAADMTLDFVMITLKSV